MGNGLNMEFVEIPISKKIGGFTDSRSFVLKPSTVAGVGVFATHGIKIGTKLDIFPHERDSECSSFIPKSILQTNPLEIAFAKTYGVAGEKEGILGYWIPLRYNHMEIGWYLNHSEDPNAIHDNNYDYFAKRDIMGGEEILIDYRDL